MERQLRTLRIWAEIQTQHLLNSIKDASPDAVAERKLAAREWLTFCHAAVLPMVADDGLELSRRMAALQDEIGKDSPVGHCRKCRAAELVETLAEAIYAQRRNA